jgi:hypothetical protein
MIPFTDKRAPESSNRISWFFIRRLVPVHIRIFIPAVQGFSGSGCALADTKKGPVSRQKGESCSSGSCADQPSAAVPGRLLNVTSSTPFFIDESNEVASTGGSVAEA